MGKMKIYTQEEMLDKSLGPKRCPARDDYEAKTEDYLLGMTIRRARESQHLTQEELGARIGVQKARISSIERGANITLSTLRRIFKALDLEVKLDIPNMQPIIL